MNQLVQDNLAKLNELCVKYHVRRLELFGSATKDNSDGAPNDLDFLVEFLSLRDGEHFDTYFGLLEELQILFERPVDLVMTRAIKNQYFLKSVNQSRTVLYAA